MAKREAEAEDLERRLLMQTQEAGAKRRELEARVCALDTLSKLLIDKAAQRDIALHRVALGSASLGFAPLVCQEEGTTRTI